MSFPALQQYLERLYKTPQAGTRVWLDAAGRAQGRYFNSTLTSAFQPIRALDAGHVVGYEGFARSYSETDDGLSLWTLLDHAASDAESVELDRLCRMLHAINFYRQQMTNDADLYLSVHARLLTAVDGNHGIAFRRVLDALGLPHDKIVLQLPQVTESQGWLLNEVSDNYRRNGFRVAVNAANAGQVLGLLDRVQPDIIKVDAREIPDALAVTQLLLRAARLGVRVIFKRVENSSTFDILRRVGTATAQAIYAQGFLWDVPQASVAAADTAGTSLELLRAVVSELDAV